MLIKRDVYNSLLRKGIKLNFWNIQNRHEVDFVYEKNGEITGIEVKSKLKNDNLSKSMYQFIEQVQPTYLYVFNETIDCKKQLGNTSIIFTHYINCLLLA